MKKLIKTATAVATAAMMAISMAVSANAVHEASPGITCNATTYYLIHHSQVGVTSNQHAIDCTVKYYAFRHTRKCPCGYSYGEYPDSAFQCTEEHSNSRCGGPIRRCGGTYSF